MSFLPSIFGHHKDQSTVSLKSQIDQVFDNFLSDWPGKKVPFGDLNGFFSPALDLAETEEGVELKVDLPDMEKDEIQLELKGDALIVSGQKSHKTERKEDKGYHVMERSYGSFRRVVPLPFVVEDATPVVANYLKGVLSVNIPRPEGVAKNSSKINIS